MLSVLACPECTGTVFADLSKENMRAGCNSCGRIFRCEIKEGKVILIEVPKALGVNVEDGISVGDELSM